MKAIPAIPAFTAIDVNALQTADWTTQGTAQTALAALKTDLDGNVRHRAAYLNAALEAAVERVRVMQAGVEAVKKKRAPPPEIDTDAKLKAVRDEVKQLSEGAKAEENGYYNAMAGFRGTNLDFAGQYKDYLSKVRATAQNLDKEVAPVPAKLTSLEGFASGLIKQLRELRGDMPGNLERREKIDAAAEKASKMRAEAATSMNKVESALKSIGNLLPKLPGSEGEMQTRAKDLNNAYERFATAMGAIQTFNKSIETMIKGFTGYGFEDGAKVPLKEVEDHLDELIKERDKVQKILTATRKNKALPEPVRKALPEKL